jgi:hypothetical protein
MKGLTGSFSGVVASICVQWTPTSGRVVAIDADLVYPQAQIDLTHPDAGLNGETRMVDQGMRLMTDDTPIMSPAEVKGALSGVRLVLKHLRELGHPLHLGRGLIGSVNHKAAIKSLSPVPIVIP